MIRAATTAPTGARAIATQLGGLYSIWLREVKRAVRDRGPAHRRHQPAAAVGADHGDRPQPYFRGEIYGEVRFVVPYTYLQSSFPPSSCSTSCTPSVQSAVSTIWDREFGFLRENPGLAAAARTILLGKVLGGTTVALFHGCLVLVLARFADVTLTPLDILHGLG
jgi:ABC-2 type transport system permease protein